MLSLKMTNLIHCNVLKYCKWIFLSKFILIAACHFFLMFPVPPSSLKIVFKFVNKFPLCSLYHKCPSFIPPIFFFSIKFTGNNLFIFLCVVLVVSHHLLLSVDGNGVVVLFCSLASYAHVVLCCCILLRVDSTLYCRILFGWKKIILTTVSAMTQPRSFFKIC